MITYIIQVAICWGLFLALYHFSLRKETFFTVNRAYLLMTLILGLIIPRLTWDISMFMEQAPIETMVEYMTISFDQLSGVLAGSSDQQSISVLSIVYWIGVCFMLAKLILGLAKIMRMHYKADIDHSGPYTIARTYSNHAPFTFFGTIYLSQLNNDPKDNEEILIHETAHVNGWHTIDVLFIELLKVLFWFNPFIYGYDHALKTVHEYIADANVLTQTALQKYGRLLLRTAQPGLEIALANHFYNHQLKQRFKMMSRTPSQKRMLIKYLSVLPFILMVSLVFTNQKVQAEIGKVETLDISNILSTNSDTEQDDRIILSKLIKTYASSTETSSWRKYAEIHEDFHALVAEKSLPELQNISNQLNQISTQLKTDLISKLSKSGEFAIGFNHGEGKIYLYPVQEIQFKINQANIALSGENPKLSYDGPMIFKADSISYNNFINESHLYGNIIIGDTLPNSSEVFKVVEKMPVFPGGKEALLGQIFQNMKYPKTAKDAGVEGLNVVSFVVEKDGSMSNVKLLRDKGSGLGEESLRVVNKIADNYNWEPGMQRGQKVRVMMNLPIKFKLEGDVKLEKEKPQIIIQRTNLNTTIQQDINGIKYTQDTIITFNPTTSEEEIQIIRNELPLDGNISELKNSKLNQFDRENFSIDTIVTFDSEKSEETIQIIRTPKEEIFKNVEQMPRFPGCEDQDISDDAKFACGTKMLIKFIMDNLTYPKSAMEKGIEGMAVVSFTVEKNGTLSDIKVIKSQDETLGKAAMKIVHLMNEKDIKWIPGVQEGQNVRVTFKLPISFKLPKDEANQNNSSANRPLIVIYDKGGQEVLKGKVNLSDKLVGDLDPNDIKSINVLKGEAAEKAFGADGSDGVIQIYLKNKAVNRPKKLRNKESVPQIEVGVEGVSIFPNPTSDLLNIHVDKVVADANLTIYTMFGQVLHQRKLSKSNSLQTLEINISKYPTGALLVAIHNKDKLFSSIVIKN